MTRQIPEGIDPSFEHNAGLARFGEQGELGLGQSEQRPRLPPIYEPLPSGNALLARPPDRFDLRNYDQRDDLTATEQEATRSYSGSGYEVMNTALRDGDGSTREAEALATAVGKSLLPTGRYLFRGRRDQPHVEVGGMVEEAAFASHSRETRIALHFADMGLPHDGTDDEDWLEALPSAYPVLFRYRLAPRAKGLYITNMGEDEIVLPPGMKWRVVARHVRSFDSVAAKVDKSTLRRRIVVLDVEAVTE